MTPPSAPDLRGLDDDEALRRFRTEGANELPTAKARTPFRIAGEVLREPMFALLLGAGAIYLALGNIFEGLILLAFATLSVAISVVQETRSERVLESLRAMTSPRALVVRQGEQRIRRRSRGDLTWWR